MKKSGSLEEKSGYDRENERKIDKSCKNQIFYDWERNNSRKWRSLEKRQPTDQFCHV